MAHPQSRLLSRPRPVTSADACHFNPVTPTLSTGAHHENLPHRTHRHWLARHRQAPWPHPGRYVPSPRPAIADRARRGPSLQSSAPLPQRLAHSRWQWQHKCTAALHLHARFDSVKSHRAAVLELSLRDVDRAGHGKTRSAIRFGSHRRRWAASSGPGLAGVTPGRGGGPWVARGVAYGMHEVAEFEK